MLALEDSAALVGFDLGVLLVLLAGSGSAGLHLGIATRRALDVVHLIRPSAGFSTGGSGALLAGPTAFSP